MADYTLITPDNAATLKVLSQVKRGWISELVWSHMGDMLAIADAAGAAIYMNAMGGEPTVILD
ncbi:MAG: hypothetical protein AAF126_24960, partial [Chloroflexota bacterium]